MFLRSVVYDQLVMRKEIGRRKVCQFTGERVDCDFWDRHFLGEGVGGLFLKKSMRKLLDIYGIVISFLKVKAIFHLRLRLESRVLTQYASVSI